jgi:hypothetical protein
MKFFRRRRYLVYGNLQIRLVAVSMGYVAFYVAVMAIATLAPLIFELKAVNSDSHRAYLLANSFLYLHRHIWPIALLILIPVGLHALLFSHKVAGPLYRFRQIFLALADGILPGPQRIRKRDYLQPEMKLINDILDSLRRKAADLQETQRAIAGSISEIAQKTRTSSDSELAALVRNLEAQGERLEKDAQLFEQKS